MRVPLRDGQWAELRERIDHGAHKRIKVAIRKGGSDEVAAVDLDDVVIREFLVAWEVRDLAGNPITLTDPDALDRLPSDIAEVLLASALEAHKAASAPKASTAS